jgi:ABC-2 type transport system ATP-binding protein
MKQRLGIAAALLPNPQLVVLDEPANGLDPAGILEIRGLIRSLAEDGITVFVSSHLLGEIEQVCDHLVMIQDGRLVFQGAVSELEAGRGVQLVARPERADQVDMVFAVVRSTGRHARIVGDEVVVDAEPGWAGDLNRLAMGMGVTLIHLSERRRSLEDAFLELTGSVGTSGQLGEVDS